MQVKLSQLLKDAQTLMEIEAILDRFYLDKRKASLASLQRTCNKHLPKIERIEHKGQLRILAFSDYRTQNIEELLRLLRHLKEKPDLIIYAGDDVDRFAPLLEAAPEGYLHYFPSGYLELPSVTIKRIREDRNYASFHISISESKRNIFEELASYAKYGLVAIIGNDNRGVDRFRIYGRNVYEIHNTWINIGLLLIVGLEGSTCGLGPSGHYSEGSVRLRLELAREFSEDKRLLIVSHSPPRGVLDRAMRFGDEAIGSLALRDFLEESNNVTLVVCGHVHRCGGKYEKINNTTIINVSSHDDPFSRANIAWIILEQSGEVEEIKWLKLPSLLETILREHDEEERLLHLQKEVRLSKNEAALFMRAYYKHGNRLLDDLPELANIKYHYGFSWSNVFKLYDYGVKAPELITKIVYENVLKESYYSIDKIHLKRAYAKVLREREKGNICLIDQIPIPDNNQIVILDTEYSVTTGVLYGFLDMESGELKQFWFDEKPKAQEYLRTKLNKVFIHWGGSDRSLLQRELSCQASTINLLYLVQTSLIAPISSVELHEVHDVLHGHIGDEFWKLSFYEKDGLYKLMLCNRILREPSDAETREELAAANKADILALQHVIEKIRQLNGGIHLHPCKVDKHKSIKETIHPIANRDIFNSIVSRLYESIIIPRREREFLTLFKVLRKASVFSNQGDVKKARFYIGLVKREWNFLRGKLPNDLQVEIESLIENICLIRRSEELEKLEKKLHQIIIEYLERNTRSDHLTKFKKAVFEQNKLLEKKALMKKLK